MRKQYLHYFLFLLAVLVFPKNVLAQTVRAGDLIKASSSAVYYLGLDNKRYVFPNERVFYSWYDNFNDVVQISDEQLASYLLGGNISYKPGSRLLKIQSDPKVYAVAADYQDNDAYKPRVTVLRWIENESLAQEFYGENWSESVDDVSDSLYFSYEIGKPIKQGDIFYPNESGYLLHDLYGQIMPSKQVCEDCILNVYKNFSTKIITGSYKDGNVYWRSYPNSVQITGVAIEGDPEIDITGLSLSYSYSGMPFENVDIEVMNSGRYYGDSYGSSIYPTFGTSSASHSITEVDFSMNMYYDEQQRNISFYFPDFKAEPNTSHQFIVTEVRGIDKYGNEVKQSVNVPLDVIRVVED